MQHAPLPDLAPGQAGAFLNSKIPEDFLQSERYSKMCCWLVDVIVELLD